MSTPVFDPLIHAPGRLQICAILSAAEAEFAVVRDAIKVSDSVLSKHVKALEEAGYVGVRKAPFDGRSRTWLSMTSKGKKAFVAHVAELERLVKITAELTV